MANFDHADRDRLIQSGRLARCNSTGREFSVGSVEVVARYSDCSVFRCPECKGTHDDRRAWHGPTEMRMGYSVVSAPRAAFDSYGNRWVAS